MPDAEYTKAIDLARRITAETGTPRFYKEREREVTLSGEWYAADPLVEAARRIAEESGDCLGHGPAHVRKVALDAGALILVEKGEKCDGEALRRLTLQAHLAGLLHDICRQEKNHAERGAEKAAQILSNFPLTGHERVAIVDAIRNHEAFRPPQERPADPLLSDALYDADKFRWGPDNFTETLWAMVIPRGIPLSKLLPRFLSGIEGIRKIRGSFRTAAGREYGPDFIDRGLAIGLRLYKELTAE